MPHDEKLGWQLSIVNALAIKTLFHLDCLQGPPKEPN